MPLCVTSQNEEPRSQLSATDWSGLPAERAGRSTYLSSKGSVLLALPVPKRAATRPVTVEANSVPSLAPNVLNAEFAKVCADLV